MNTSTPTDKNHQFPPEIISHGVWLYVCFCLSYRDVTSFPPSNTGKQQEVRALTTAAWDGRLLLVTPNRIVPTRVGPPRRSLSRLKGRRDAVGRGLRRLDQLSDVHAF
jgi:hypothetical protein